MTYATKSARSKPVIVNRNSGHVVVDVANQPKWPPASPPRKLECGGGAWPSARGGDAADPGSR